jgi:hypothetical protein
MSSGRQPTRWVSSAFGAGAAVMVALAGSAASPSHSGPDLQKPGDGLGVGTPVHRAASRMAFAPAGCDLTAGASGCLLHGAHGVSGAHTPDDLVLFRAIDLALGPTHNPGLYRAEALEALRTAPLCFRAGLTPEEYAEAMESYLMRPPSLGVFDPDEVQQDFVVSSTVWRGDGGTFTLNASQSNGAVPANLTYSFPDDGVPWGATSSGFQVANNVLSQRLRDTFGSNNLDQGREYIRQGLASWRKYSSLRYEEVADDNSAFSTAQQTVRNPNRGDIRIGGIPLTTTGGSANTSVLAYNFFPNAGGDMVINTRNLGVGNFFTIGAPANDYILFKQTIAHEHGHGIGVFHVVPCNATKLMEPQINQNSPLNGVQIDDIRAAGRLYGDKFAPNHTTATATNFGNLTAPIRRSVIERFLSTNGQTSGQGSTGEDWFRFTIDTPEDIFIQVTPAGGTYNQGAQTSGCSGSTTSTNASAAGNLNVMLLNSNATVIIEQAASNPAGSIESFLVNALPAGTYTVRVWDSGPNANQTLQLYHLLIGLGNGPNLPNRAPAPPDPIAGVNKRVGASQTAFFNAGFSTSNEQTSITSYDWDLDGDGVFEIVNQIRPTRTYTSNGLYPVTLRVTDAAGLSATDTINVTVVNAISAITGVVPSAGEQGQTIPVVINGNNFKGVTSAGQLSFSGSGIGVIGTPTVNTAGTQITGLSLVIDPAAPTGLQNLTITNTDGPPGQPWGGGQSAFRLNAFRVDAAPTIACNSADIAQTDGTPGPDGQVDNGDFALFFNLFFTSSCPNCGQPAAPACNAADIAQTDASPGPDGCIDNGDFGLFFVQFFAGCP